MVRRPHMIIYVSRPRPEVEAGLATFPRDVQGWILRA